MKQGQAKSVTEVKREPTAKSVSEEAVSQIGTLLAYKRSALYEGRGFEAPKDKACDCHKSGSQGRH